jgi:hypothetical protein
MWLASQRRRRDLAQRALVERVLPEHALAPSSPRARAVYRLTLAARDGDYVTQADVARWAGCSIRTVRRAKAAMVATGLCNVHLPAPMRDRNGQCVGRDRRGSRFHLAMLANKARALWLPDPDRPPKGPPKAPSTKSGLRGPSHPHLPGVLDGKPAAQLRPVRQQE